MSSESPATRRFVAFDVHKHYVVVAAVDAQQTILLHPKRISLAELDDWMTGHLVDSDAAVLEAGPNTWHLYDRITPHVSSVSVANPYLVKLIAMSSVKTNGRDALTLARYLAAGILPTVWVPPAPVRDLRVLVGHRARLVRQRTQARNRLQSVLHRHALTSPHKDPFAREERSWWEGLPLSSVERLCVRNDLALLDSLAPLIEATNAAILDQSTQTPWKEEMPYLLQVSGFGVLNAMILLAGIGTITRFPSARHLVGYAGLGVRVYDSGQTHRSGGITKQGRREMRTALVEAAWIAVAYDQRWKAEFQRLCRRMVPAKAIVAIARKMMVVIWHVLTDHVADRAADPKAVARKFFRWGAELRAARRQNLTLAAFTRQELDRLGIGQELDSVVVAGRCAHLPPLTPGLPLG
jgi:transposase